ncbi:MAG TPA: right-handed parallel beta-helix repeat-containing protein [Terriglobales bacterium]|nr:right-handed parallel beta-helix repeat-containing protein [Terriglobales bacterium]
MNKKHQLLLVVAVGITLAAPASWADTVAVGTCRSHLTSYSTIQAAVNAVKSGSTILVCPGFYPEQVTIHKQLTVEGVQAGTANAAVITSPATGLVGNATSLTSGNPIAAQILVSNTLGPVDISNLTIDGANNLITGCLPNPMGIFYQNASGTISEVATRNQSISPYSSFGGCQSGLGIFVQSGGTGAITTSHVTVSGSTVHDYQKNGITGNEAGTRLTVLGNSVMGMGPVSGAAQHGIQIGYGATGTIQGNSVFDDIWAPDTINDAGDAAAGILLYASSGVYVYGNNVGDTQFGIAVVTDPAFPPADSNRIKANQVSGTHIFDGIDVCSNNNRIRDNIVNTIDEAGIHIDSTCTGGNSGNIVTNNTINEACAGLLTGATPQDNVLVPNFLFNVTNTQLAGDTCGSGPAISAGTTAGANLPHHVAGTHRNYAPVRP